MNYELEREAGEKYVYNNAEIFLLSVFFQEAFGENISLFINREIFQPLGINNYKWGNYDKYCIGGTGLYLSNEDQFKIGQLILNKGCYQNTQIISRSFIEEMCKVQIDTPYAIKPGRLLPKCGVGFVMHISRDGYVYKDGTNGQYLIINFEKEQIISIQSTEKEMNLVIETLRGII